MAQLELPHLLRNPIMGQFFQNCSLPCTSWLWKTFYTWLSRQGLKNWLPTTKTMVVTYAPGLRKQNAEH